MMIVDKTPKITPFAMTIPISFPKVSCMAHNAKKPAMVVTEDEVMEVKVA